MNRVLLIFIIVVVFSAVMLALQGFYWYRVTEKEREARELSRRLGTGDGDAEENELLFKLALKRDGDDSLDIAERIERKLLLLLLHAGQPYSFQSLVGQMALAALVGMAAMGLVFKSLPLALLGTALAYVPVMLVRSKANARAARLTEQLPDALDMVARSLQAGHGIAESLRGCAEEMDMPISGEFGLVYEQNNLGRDFRDCMNALLGRNPSNFDLKIFASSVLLQRETGGNLIEILNGISNTIRKRFLFKGKVRALTAEARFSAIILGALPIVIFGAIKAIRPEYLDPLFNDPIGFAMVAFVCTWFTLGVIVMVELTKIEA